MKEGSSIFEISIRKAVEKALEEKSAETVKDYINKVSELLLISIGNMPIKEELKKSITKIIEDE